MKKYLYPAIGVAAFVLGGILTRNKALDALEELEKIAHKHKDEPSTPVAE